MLLKVNPIYNKRLFVYNVHYNVSKPQAVIVNKWHIHHGKIRLTNDKDRHTQAITLFNKEELVTIFIFKITSIYVTKNVNL